MINRLKSCSMNDSLMSIYDYNDNTITELLCEFFHRINNCIDVSNSALNFLDWVKNEGLAEEVIKYLTELLENGTIQELINDKIFGDINSKLNNRHNEVYIEEFEGADDTEKINKAISFLINGGTIKLKAKTYIFDNIVIPQDISLIGTTNTIIKPKQETTNPIIHFTGNNHVLKDIIYDDNGLACKGFIFGDFGSITGSGKISNIKIENVKAIINVAKNPVICVGYCANVTITKNSIININKADKSNLYAQGICVHSDDQNYCDNVIITDNYINGFYSGIILWGTGLRKNILISNNIVEDCCHVGIDGYHAGRISITNNIINRCYIGIFGDVISIDGDNGRGAIISNNQIRGSEHIGLYFEELSNSTINGNTVQDSKIGIYGGGGLKHSLITGNTSSFNEIGIYISNEYVPSGLKDYYNQDCSIKNNIVTFNSKQGIKLLGLRGVWNIQGNTILSNNTGNTDIFGMEINSDSFQSTNKPSEYVHIKDNILDNNGLTTGGIRGYQTKGIYVSCGSCYISGNNINASALSLDSRYSRPQIVGNIFGSALNLLGNDHRAIGNIGLADKTS